MAAGAPVLETEDDLVAAAEIGQPHRIGHHSALTVDPVVNTQLFRHNAQSTGVHRTYLSYLFLKQGILDALGTAIEQSAAPPL